MCDGYGRDDDHVLANLDNVGLPTADHRTGGAHAGREVCAAVVA